MHDVLSEWEITEVRCHFISVYYRSSKQIFYAKAILISGHWVFEILLYVKEYGDKWSPFLWKPIWMLACKPLPISSVDILLVWFDPLLYCVECSFIYYTKCWPGARLHMSETNSRVSKTDSASILSKCVAHTWSQLHEQLGNHRMNEKWHKEWSSSNMAKLWMEVWERSLFEKG